MTSGVPVTSGPWTRVVISPLADSRPMYTSLNTPGPSGGNGAGRLPELGDRQRHRVLQLSIDLLGEVAALGVRHEEAGDRERHGHHAEADVQTVAQPHRSTRKQYPTPRTVWMQLGLRVVELAAEIAHVRLHHRGVAVEVVAPHVVEDLRPADARDPRSSSR